MGIWIKKTGVTPISSESKVINTYDTSEDWSLNTYSINVIRARLEAIRTELLGRLSIGYVKKNYAVFENPENYINLRSGDTLNRVSFVKNMNTIYFSAIITLNSDLEPLEYPFTFVSSDPTYGQITPSYSFDVLTVVGSGVRSFEYNPIGDYFGNSGATINSGQVLRFSTSWAVEE